MTATTAFVESCVETVAGSAVAAERRARKQPRARALLDLLADKKNVLITTHQHPDTGRTSATKASGPSLRSGPGVGRD